MEQKNYLSETNQQQNHEKQYIVAFRSVSSRMFYFAKRDNWHKEITGTTVMKVVYFYNKNQNEVFSLELVVGRD